MTRRRIAVIGGGISGLTAAHILSRSDEVTLFEADGRLGGHADTHLVDEPGGRQVAVDTGFIVYNERTYPLLTRLFAELGVETRSSEMSMSVSCSGCGVRYAGKRGPAGLGAGVAVRRPRLPANAGRGADSTGPRGGCLGLLRPGLGLELEPESAAGPSLGDFLREGGFSAYFTEHFAVPVVASVWSCPQGTALQYPAAYLFAFLANHGMLSVSGSPQWRTVTGGSGHYVELIAAGMAQVRLSSPVRSVSRRPDGVTVLDGSGAETRLRRRGHRHPPRPGAPAARRADPGGAVGARGVQLHPQRGGAAHRRPAAAARAGRPGVLELLPQLPRRSAATQARVSYDMNRLQGLPPGRDYIVTLGGREDVDPASVIAVMDYAHPAYTRESVAAQSRLPGLNTSVTRVRGRLPAGDFTRTDAGRAWPPLGPWEAPGDRGGACAPGVLTRRGVMTRRGRWPTGRCSTSAGSPTPG